MEIYTGGTHWDAARNPSGRDVMVDHSQQDASAGPAPKIWPVKAPYLWALTDLGMSDAQIARYFNVPPTSVSNLRETLQEKA